MLLNAFLVCHGEGMPSMYVFLHKCKNKSVVFLVFDKISMMIKNTIAVLVRVWGGGWVEYLNEECSNPFT